MIRRFLRALYFGPRLGFWDDDDCDEAEFVGANPDLYLGPIPSDVDTQSPSN